MEKTFDTLMEQTEDCLREYSKKKDWNTDDLECIKDAVCIYEKLQKIVMDCGAAEYDRESFRSYGMRNIHSGRSYGGYDEEMQRAPRYYEYDGSLTSYRNDGYSNRRRASRRGRGDMRSMHSIEDRMVATLENMMDDAGSEYEREKIMEFINLAKDRERK